MHSESARSQYIAVVQLFVMCVKIYLLYLLYGFVRSIFRCCQQNQSKDTPIEEESIV